MALPPLLSPFRHLILINLMCYANRASAIRHAHSSLSAPLALGIGMAADTPLPFGRIPDAVTTMARSKGQKQSRTDCDARGQINACSTALLELEVCQNIAVGPASRRNSGHLSRTKREVNMWTLLLVRSPHEGHECFITFLIHVEVDMKALGRTGISKVQ